MRDLCGRCTFRAEAGSDGSLPCKVCSLDSGYVTQF